MSNSLQAKYIRVLDYCSTTLVLRDKMLQLRPLYSAGPIDPSRMRDRAKALLVGLSYYFLKEVKLMWNPKYYLGLMNSEVMENVYASADEALKQDPIFVALTSNSPLENLAKCMKEDIPLRIGDATRLSKIHELNKSKLRLSNPFILVTFLTGALAVLSKLIPKEVFGEHVDAYRAYQLIVFGLIGLFLIVILPFATLFWLRYVKAKNQYEFCEALLAYRTVLDEDEKDPPNVEK